MATHGTTSRVRLELHANGLRNVAGAFKGISDPYAVVTQLANDMKEAPRILGKTEVYVCCWSCSEYERARDCAVCVCCRTNELFVPPRPVSMA